MDSKYIPNIITGINLTTGVLSLVMLMADNFTGAAALVLLATILDSMDGKVARRFEVSSAFGRELDSLADLVSFGVAPALLVYAVTLVSFGIPGLLTALIFVICGALRLARFNTTAFNGKYEGIPITAAGGLMSLLILVARDLNGCVFLLLMLTLSFLMISRITVPKF
ncbi:MAG: CDP-diacylglycerol--serine O-phosphatidyltransferase [Desulfotomaculum sp.]|nr:CDP-diacylglycerol--serine O-phosphatidyltransferase [Desulfotomaculum sp.]